MNVVSNMFDIIIYDEAAYINNFKEMYASDITCISNDIGSRVIIVSTPNGCKNYFYELEEKLVGYNSVEPILVNYKDNPNFGEKWYDNMCKLMNNDIIKITQELHGHYYIEEQKKTKDKQILFRVDE